MASPMRIEPQPESSPPAVVIPRLLTKELITQHYVPVNVRTLERWISAGEFPPADLKHGPKLLFWFKETVDRWYAAYVAKHSTARK